MSEHCFHHLPAFACCQCGSATPFTPCPGKPMGFHTCHICNKETSSGEVTLDFVSGNSYCVPDMILHYIRDHDFRPPDAFVNDVLQGHSERYHYKIKGEPVKVGWLAPGKEFATWDREQARLLFADQLERLLRNAISLGLRRQTRSLNPGEGSAANPG